MKYCYKDKSFKAASLAIIEQANDIIEEYQAQGYSLTLRQLYYQFVARDLIENTQRSYKRLGSIINDGRMAGLIDWSSIEDRTRNVITPVSWTSPASILRVVANQFTYDLRADQDHAIEVWVEKEALMGVIEPICDELFVACFACRGYVSQSEQWNAGIRMRDRGYGNQGTIILHLGDHDPSGMDMTRDNSERLNMFSEGNTTLVRIALNMDQVNQYDPPPNPAKFTDSRCHGYVQEYGNSSWELDALEPRVLTNLIKSHVDAYTDQARLDEMKQATRIQRDRLAKVAEEWVE